MRICTNCGPLPDTEFHPSNKRKITRCRKCVNQKQSEYFDSLRENQSCLDCHGPTSGKTLCDACREKRRLYRHDPKNRPSVLATEKAKRLRLKLEVFNYYGGPICKCCGETHMEFLSIDHVNNDGASHRRTLKGGGCGEKLYDWLKRNKYPPGYQVLCMNCNFAKGHFGVCPHETEKANQPSYSPPTASA